MSAPLFLSAGLLRASTAALRPTSQQITASWLSLVFGLCGILAGLYLFLRGFRFLQQKKWIEDTPISKISAVAMGPVKILGRATGPYTLLSPLANVECLFYCAVAWNGKDDRNPDRLAGRAAETLFTPLFVEDGTGRLMIDPRDVELALPPEYDGQSSNTGSECSAQFLRRHGISPVDSANVTEYAIKPGDPLLVMATLRDATAVDYVSYEAADLQRREQLEAIGAPVRESFSHAADNSGFDLRPSALLGKGTESPIFLLARENPRSFIEDLGRRSAIGIWAGPALAVFSLGLLLKGMGLF